MEIFTILIWFYLVNLPLSPVALSKYFTKNYSVNKRNN